MMDLCNINDIKNLLERHGFRFSKAMGQNFLTQSWVPERIVLESGVSVSSGVLEIGPGIGCLTEKLSDAAGKVAAVELDKRLLPVLEETLANRENVAVINGDIMKLDLSDIVSKHFSGLEPCVCANLPYNITTPVLMKLIDSSLFSSITVMVQKEVALRLSAEAGSKDYGAISVYAAYHTEAKRLFDVPPSCFIPQPQVTSSVINMKIRKTPPIRCDEELLFKVVRSAFGKRRKTLANALSSDFQTISKDDILQAIECSGLPTDIRGEALSLKDFAAVTEYMGELLK